jgi:hypothetical protein
MKRHANTLVVCSLCMRVHLDSEWVDAEHVIREIRSYELDVPPPLESTVCDTCAEAIFSRRMQPVEAIAA